jgi:hypothetical protein
LGIAAHRDAFWDRSANRRAVLLVKGISTSFASSYVRIATMSAANGLYAYRALDGKSLPA